MKKRIIVFLTLFFIFPLFVKASDVSYTIDHYYINADIQTNGDLKVTELLVLDGSFNGYIRDLSFRNSKLGTSGYESNQIYNATGIEAIEIAAKKVKEVSFDTLFDSDFTILQKGQASQGGYIEYLSKSMNSYQMYFQSKKNTVAFRITYTIKDVLVLHKDVAELYWTFIGSEYDDDIHDLIIKVNLPGVDKSDLFRIWAHGDLAGEVQKKNDKQIVATLKKVDSNSSVDLRATFSPSLMDENQMTKVNPVSALDEILKVEEKRAEVANKERMQMKIIYYSFLIVSLFYIVIQILVWIYVYKKYDKEYKSTFTNQYNREFIDDYNVEVVDYLFHQTITSNALSASIMNLIYKKAIVYQEIETEKKKKVYLFTKTEHRENINETEQYLLKFLFEKVGNGTTFTTEELHKYAKGTKTCESFSTNYTNWKKKVIQDGKKQKFYENTNKAVSIGILFLFLGILLNVLHMVMHAVVPFVYVAGFLSGVFFIYTLCFSKRTIKGNDHYVRWKAFKNFLNDFGTFDNKELPEIVLWERYMVYATLFGLAEKVSKVMNVKIKELENSGVYVGGYSPSFTDWYVFHSINTSISNSIQANTTAITAARANSSSSSGSGFGGGFSSGGGFGGGGGGGRGF